MAQGIILRRYDERTTTNEWEVKLILKTKRIGKWLIQNMRIRDKTVQSHHRINCQTNMFLYPMLNVDAKSYKSTFVSYVMCSQTKLCKQTNKDINDLQKGLNSSKICSQYNFRWCITMELFANHRNGFPDVPARNSWSSLDHGFAFFRHQRWDEDHQFDDVPLV